MIDLNEEEHKYYLDVIKDRIYQLQVMQKKNWTHKRSDEISKLKKFLKLFQDKSIKI